MSEQAATTTRGWSERWSPLGGLVFGLATAGVFIFANVDTGETPQEVIEAAAEHETEIGALGLLGLVSIPLLLWFFSGLHARVSRLGSRTAPALVLTGGTAFALLFFLAVEIWSAPLIDFPGEADATAGANAFLTIDDIGWFTLGGAGVSFAVMAVAASVAALRASAVPSWAGWLSLVVGLAAAATITFFGILAWLAWLILVPIALLLRRA